MERRWQFSLMMLLALTAIGCESSSTPSTKSTTATNPKATPAVAQAKPQAAAGVQPENKDDPAAAEEKEETSPTGKEGEKPSANPEASATKSDKSADAVSKSEPQPEPPKPEPPKPERVAIFTPGGPLLVDVTMTLDGRPYNAAFDEQLAALLKAADTDEDGAATWQELMDNEEYLSNGVAERTAMNARQKRDAIEQYDLNDDGHIQKQEATAWLGRDAGRSAAAFRVRGSREYVPSARTHSRVWPFLDRDGNGELSAEEIAATGTTLLELDADDDQVLTLDELASLREQLMGQNQMNAASDATRDAAIHLEPGYTIERLDYLLPDLYSPRQTLSPESFSALPKLFEQLDKSGEEWLDRDELANLLTIEPHVRLTVEFRSTPAADQPPATVKLEGASDEVKQLGDASGDRLTLALGATRLEISATGGAVAVAPAMASGGGDQNQLQLTVHDQQDALFQELDADGDGRLGTREMTDGAKRLAARDANGDGVLSVDELPYSMIVAFTRGTTRADGYYAPPRMAAPLQNAKAPAWFASADFNGDGDVSRREFLGEAARFDEIDRDGNGFIDALEAMAISETFEAPEETAPSSMSTEAGAQANPESPTDAPAEPPTAVN